MMDHNHYEDLLDEYKRQGENPIAREVFLAGVEALKKKHSVILKRIVMDTLLLIWDGFKKIFLK